MSAFLMLLCSTCIVSRRATACPSVRASGPLSFTAAPGRSHSQIWSVYYGFGVAQISITAGSDVFSVDTSIFLSGVTPPDSDTFTLTFSPPANSTGTFVGTMTIGGDCNKYLTFSLSGTVAAASGVENALPSNVSVTISPNPATDYIAVATSNARSAEIEIFDMLGKEIASSKTTTWKWDASNTATGSYTVRIVGESFSGDPFVISRRIIIAR
jgi:Secretion system C-terminal sorting domain